MASFSAAPAALTDAEAVAEVQMALESAVYGQTTFSPADLLDEWSEFDLAQDTFVFRDGERIIGYGLVRERGKTWTVEGYVHPAEHGRGLGTQIATTLEDAAARGGATAVRNAVFEADPAACALMQSLGYEVERIFREMRIVLDAPPAPPEWPAGLVAGAVDPERDMPAFHAAHEEAFLDHWEHTQRDFAAWSKRFRNGERFDPSLWRAVRDGDEIVAGTISTLDTYGGGWIHVVFTRRPWRRRGLGAALLDDAFGRLWEHGERAVGLGVDAGSETGAFRLYERAGMAPALGWAAYQKTLGT